MAAPAVGSDPDDGISRLVSLIAASKPQNLKTSKPQNLKTSKPQNLKTSKPQHLKTSKPQNLKTSKRPIRSQLI